MIHNLNPIIVKTINQNFSKKTMNDIQLILLGIEHKLNLDSFGIFTVATVSGFSFVSTNIISDTLTLDIPLTIAPKKKTQGITEEEIEVLKEIQVLFRDINRSRSGSIAAIKLRYSKIKNTYNITIDNAFLAAKVYLEDENPDMILTCEKFFYAGAWSNRQSKLMSVIDNMEYFSGEEKIPGLL